MIEADVTDLMNVSWMAWSLGWMAAEEVHDKYPEDETKPHPHIMKMIDDFYETMLSANDDGNYTLYGQFISMLLNKGYIKKDEFQQSMFFEFNLGDTI